ncbi:MAG: hypothetical protein ABIO70_11010 [Pseudomonadota bacterium]
MLLRRIVAGSVTGLALAQPARAAERLVVLGEPGEGWHAHAEQLVTEAAPGTVTAALEPLLLRDLLRPEEPTLLGARLLPCAGTPLSQDAWVAELREIEVARLTGEPSGPLLDRVVRLQESEPCLSWPIDDPALLARPAFEEGLLALREGQDVRASAAFAQVQARAPGAPWIRDLPPLIQARFFEDALAASQAGAATLGVGLLPTWQVLLDGAPIAGDAVLELPAGRHALRLLAPGAEATRGLVFETAPGAAVWLGSADALPGLPAARLRTLLASMGPEQQSAWVVSLGPEEQVWRWEHGLLIPRAPVQALSSPAPPPSARRQAGRALLVGGLATTALSGWSLLAIRTGVTGGDIHFGSPGAMASVTLPLWVLAGSGLVAGGAGGALVLVEDRTEPATGPAR